MTWGVHDALGDRLVSGVAVGPVDAEPPAAVAWHTGRHPIPDHRSEAAGRAIVTYLESADVDFVLFLISGGGSALAEIPPAGVTIDELGSIQRRLMDASVPIEQLNLVRRSVSLLKNGRLLDHLSVPHETLLISDVGDEGPEVIASGPTLPEPIDPTLVRAVLERAGIEVSDPIAAHLSTLGTTTQNDAWTVIADGWSAAETAAGVLRTSGLNVSIPRRSFSGEARRVAPAMVRGAESGFTVAPGESTVTITGDGVGGRNTEAALAVAIQIDGRDDVVFASLTTDGVDGATDTAGAIVDGGTAARILAAGISPEASLMNNDSQLPLDAAGDLVRTGPTGTNVADLWFVWTR